MSFLLFATSMRVGSAWARDLAYPRPQVYMDLLFSYHRSHPWRPCRTDGKQIYACLDGE